MADIECVFESMTDKGSIYISNFTAAQNTQLLRKKGIRAIVSVARSGLLRHSKEEVPDYLYLPAQDHEEYDIYRFFNQTFDFIEQARKHTNVLVHCMAGVSRSVTIVIAYLLKKYKSSLGEIIMMLQRKRSKINPNKGFIEQLKKYALQEGLTCNFDYEQVPVPRERSFSKGRSISKERSKVQYNLGNPLGMSYRDNSAFKLALITKNKADTNDRLKKDNASNISPKRKPLLNAEENEEIRHKLYPQNEPFPLKKRYSQDNKSPLCDKRLSIEEKIRKVREKIAQKQQLKRSLEKKESLSPKKENKLIVPTETNPKLSSKHLSQYFTHYSKQYADSIKGNQQKPTPNKQDPPVCHAYQPQILFCATEGPVLRKQERVEPRNIYSKVQKKRGWE